MPKLIILNSQLCFMLVLKLYLLEQGGQQKSFMRLAGSKLLNFASTLHGWSLNKFCMRRGEVKNVK